ncbi:hypothetical protein BOTBODRAFT_70139 [Botryobasidium botryosum FD-172 SS1]|uniref:Uncharacterized protein n=1 Tax=Botryobasidium botryosum (strain FD-172 SS1) TaxID=930990 RepID=A0A067M7G1_BOTB1|nr:hypothetical protein BOTBODRAFT_70139 [Botryobasidium botryosum FD-172 SS1]
MSVALSSNAWAGSNPLSVGSHAVADRRAPSASDETLTDSTLNSFEQVAQNLSRLGGVHLERFASPTVDFESLQPAPPAPAPDDQSDTIEKRSILPLHAVQHLHQACQRAFVHVTPETLKFEFLEEFGPTHKSCILTITRPGGASRSYTTKAEFSRKNEAKARAAAIAIEMGAVDFILYGDAEPDRKSAAILAPLDAPARSLHGKDTVKSEGNSDTHAIAITTTPAPPDGDKAIEEIEKCCEEWRAGRVRPVWVFTADTKTGTAYGCALKIELSPHSVRVYSVDTAYKKRLEAKAGAALVAMQQNVLDFIRYGNGQTEPEPRAVEYGAAPSMPAKKDPNAVPAGVTLASFYDALPKPLPDPVGLKAGEEANPVAWVNQLVQQARGSRLTLGFTWTSDAKHGSHGCLLRLELPTGESRSFLVDSVFSKRQDAKTAVCLLAVSQGVGEYIRSLGEKYDEKLTKAMKDRAKELMTTIANELQKVKPGLHANYTFEQIQGAFGCTMVVELAPDMIRNYTANTEYRSRLDAKAAVTLRAQDEGVLEFIRFRGKTPPLDYDPAWHDKRPAGKPATYTRFSDAPSGGDSRPFQKFAPTNVGGNYNGYGNYNNGYNNKYNSNYNNNYNQKKRKIYQDADPDAPPMFETREEALARGQSYKKGFNNHKQGFWKKPQGPSFGPSSASGPDSVREAYKARSAHLSGAPRGSFAPHAPPYSSRPAGDYASDPASAPTSEFYGGGGSHSPSQLQPRSYSSPYLNQSSNSYEGYSRNDEQPGRGGGIDDPYYAEAGPFAHEPYRYDDADSYDYYGRPVVPPPAPSAPVPSLDVPPPSARYHYDEDRYPHYPVPDSYSHTPIAPPVPPPPPSSSALQGYEAPASEFEYDPYHPRDPYPSEPPFDTPRFIPGYDGIRDPPPAPMHTEYPLDRPPYNPPSRTHSHSPVPPAPASAQYDYPPYEEPPLLVPRRGYYPKKNSFGRKPSMENKRGPGTIYERPRLGSGPPAPPPPSTNYVEPPFRRTSSGNMLEPRVPPHPVPVDRTPYNNSNNNNSHYEGKGVNQVSYHESQPILVPREPPRISEQAHNYPPPAGSPAPKDPSSYVTQLFDFCTQNKIHAPKFHSEEVAKEMGTEHRVWMIMGKERLELPTTFADLYAGRERLSKQVLTRLRTKQKKGKEVATA